MQTNVSRRQETGGTTDVQAAIEREIGDEILVPVAGGVLVYETRPVGRELIGFEDVTDWEDVAEALAVRGHARGAIHHLPEFDGAEAGDGA